MQLKCDVIEGKLPCTPEQAVLLAAYSVQGTSAHVARAYFVQLITVCGYLDVTSASLTPVYCWLAGEFGDFVEGKHCVEFFKDFVLLPRVITTSLSDLTLYARVGGSVFNV